MLLSPNFSNLTTEGYTAFILAIVFTIFTFASFFFFARHKNLNKILLGIITLLMPFVTIFCWVYLLLDILKYKLFVNLAISLGSAAGYVLIAVCVALVWMLATRNNTDKPKKEKKKKKKHVEEEEPEEEPEPETYVAPKLLEHKPVEQITIEVVDEQKTESTEEVPAEKPQPKKRGRKKKVETTEEVTEETTEEVQEIPVEQVEEAPAENTEEVPAENAQPKKRGRKKKTEEDK